MNNRIRKLAYAAANGMLSYDAEGEWRLSQKEIEKFAELIVQECLEQIRLSIPSEQTNDFEQGAKWAFEESVIVIEEHFGVDK